MNKEQLKILTSLQVEQKLQRIARQLVEEHYTKKELIIVGVSSRGVKIAAKLQAILAQISTLSTTLLTITIDKDNPNENAIELSADRAHLANKTVILVDDVLNSGKTLIHAASYLLNENLAQLSTVVLLDRKHRLFPIRADFVGMTLSTTLKDHITVVEVAENTFEAYLK